MYDFISKEILNPETVPERVEELLSLLVNNLISSPGLECTRHSQAYIYSFLIIIQYHLFPVFVRFAA